MARMLSTDSLVTSQVSVDDESIVKTSEEGNADGFWETDDVPAGELSDDISVQDGELPGNDVPAIISTVQESEPAETTSTQEPPTVEGIQESESTEVIWDKAAERAKDERNFFEALKEARLELKTAESEWEGAKSNAKIAKEEYSLAQARLYQIAEDGVVYRKKPQPKKAIEAKQPIKQKPQEEPNQVVGWENIETSTILAGIEGLGAKKRDLLIESFPTFRHLMEARTESSKEHVTFASKLPKGIGEGIATEIIDRMDRAIVPGM